ncbi:MAG TPA: twin-arginine translocase TatA/TatE family subunit [Flavobacteriaceae bacterium]|nr:twin-arginine translocase TatA/TatE family subunit [Flavobacteriaceae bacterium]
MHTFPLIFGMSGGEIAFVIFAALLLFGADKIPDIARNLGKGIRMVKNATNDIKSEITKSSEQGSQFRDDTTKNLTDEVKKVKEDIEKITGSVKRKF